MATMEIFREYTFDAAHMLIGVHAQHKCARLHGHTYRVRIVVAGPVDFDTGMVVDFADIDAVVKPVIATLDHVVLNEVPGLRNPTAENIAHWLWTRLADRLHGLTEVSVYETANSGCTYRGTEQSG